MTAKQALQHEWFSNPTHADEFEAVYQHAIQDWVPKRNIFRLVELLNSPRPKMELNQSRFFDQPASSERESFSVTLASGQSSILPSIVEETDCPHASPAGPPSTVQGEFSEVPGPPCSQGETAPNELISGWSSVSESPPKEALTPTQSIHSGQLTREDLSSTQDPDSAKGCERSLTPRQLIQVHKAQQESQMLYGSGTASARGSSSYIPRPPDTEPDSVSQELTHLSLLEQQHNVMTNDSSTNMQASQMTESSSSEQPFDFVSSGKRQPSFDFDENIDDADLLEAEASVELSQAPAKRLRIG